jgi:Sigma-70, non-essential region
VKSLRLNRARIDALVEQLYDINKRLVGYEGRLMRLAEGHGVSRDAFLKNYQGSELDPRWLNRVSKLSAKGWKSLIAKDKVKQHRHEIQVLAGETGLEIGEFRKIGSRTCASSSRSLLHPSWQEARFGFRAAPVTRNKGTFAQLGVHQVFSSLPAYSHRHRTASHLGCSLIHCAI